MSIFERRDALSVYGKRGRILTEMGWISSFLGDAVVPGYGVGRRAGTLALLLLTPSFMYHFFEDWRARPPWLDLTVRERTAYLDRFGPEMERLADEGVALLGIVLKETRFLHRVECQYRALWAVPAGLPQVRALNTVLERHGWGTYFDRYRARIEPVRRTARSPTAAPVKTNEKWEASVSVNGEE